LLDILGFLLPEFSARRLHAFAVKAVMAKRCEICGKGPVVGRQHSHANNVSPRRAECQSVSTVINGGNKRIQYAPLPAVKKVVKAA
jgi:large subunit ribosomal protein L28